MTRRSDDEESISEEFLDRCEEAYADSLRQQVEAAARDFKNGDVVSLAELKRRNNL
jgi:hypothetical protein